MSLEDFQLIDNEATDKSHMKRDVLKIYHQQAASLIYSDQNIEFIFGENNNYHQIGNAYLEYELKIEKHVAVAANRVLVYEDAIRLVINTFAYCFKEAGLSTTRGSDIEQNKYVGQMSTIRRFSTSKDRDLLSHFNKIDASKDEIENNSLHHHLTSKHDVAVNKGKIFRTTTTGTYFWILNNFL